MSYLSSGYWNWLGVGRSGLTLDGPLGKDLPRQPDFDPMFHSTKCSLNLWDENRRLYMDNLRLWDCLTLIRSDPSTTCQSAIDLIFSLRDSEYLISFPDTHQLMLLRYPTGFVSHTNIDDAKLENVRLKDENSRLHAAIWVLRDNPSLQADSTVAAVFRLDENQFQAKFHADPDVSGGNLFKFTDKQTYANNNKVYVASLDIGTQPNMAIQLTNKPIKAGLTSFRRSRSASSRRPHSRGYASLAQNGLTRKRSGSSIHHHRGVSNWGSDRLLASDRMFFVPQEDIHTGLYTKRHPRAYGDNNEPNCPRQNWPADGEQEEYNVLATEIRADYNNSQVDDITVREKAGPEMSASDATGSDTKIQRPKAQRYQIILSFQQTHIKKKIKSRMRKRAHKARQRCPAVAASRRMGLHMANLCEAVEYKCKIRDECKSELGEQLWKSENNYFNEEKRNDSLAGEIISLCMSETNVSVVRCNKNDNMRDELPSLQEVNVIEAQEPTKTHLKCIAQNNVLDPQTTFGKSESCGLDSLEVNRPGVYKLLPKTRSDLSSACTQQYRVDAKISTHKERPLTAKKRDFKRVRLDNLNSVAKWGAQETALQGESSVALKEGNGNANKAQIQGLSSNNNTTTRRDTVSFNQEDSSNIKIDTRRDTVLFNQEVSSNIKIDTRRDTVLFNQEVSSNIKINTRRDSVIYNASMSDATFRGAGKSLTIIPGANSKSKTLLPIRTLASSTDKNSSPEIVYSDKPAQFKAPTWQQYSFQGFTSVKHFLDRQKWLQDGEKMLKSDKTFYTRAVSPTLYALNEEDYLTSKRSPNLTNIHSPIQASDYFQIRRKTRKNPQHPHRQSTHSLPEIESKKRSALDLANTLLEGEVQGCDDPIKCQDDESKSLKLLYGLGNWKYTKPLATMLKHNRCVHKTKIPKPGIV